jgi:hypothetical protein
MLTPHPTAPPAHPLPRSKRVLAPQERIAEVLFGLIMVLTFTGSLSVAEAGRDDVRAMIIGALGCNLAWGLIDGVLYLMTSLADRGRNFEMFRALRCADAGRAGELVAAALPPVVASVLRADELESIRRRLLELPAPPATVRLQARDWLGASAVALLVFLCTFPVVVPFLFVRETAVAMRLSNAVAVALLAVTGVAYGRQVGRSAWVFGLLMVVLGGLLVALTIALGG